MKQANKAVPIVDCLICGTKDVPLSHEATMTKQGKPTIEIWVCSCCGCVPNLTGDVKIKRYISVKELEELGWAQEKKEGGI